MRFCFIFALSSFLSQTDSILDLSRILIREEDSSAGERGLDDPNDFYGSFLLSANDPESSQDIFDTTGSMNDQYPLDSFLADDGEAIPGSPPNLLVPQSEDLLAFHDGELPPPGWGDCEFPKTPACCEYDLVQIHCVWYLDVSDLCPGHPDDYSYPRGPKEQDRYRPVCCDQIQDGVGIGCVPVTGRDEEEGYDNEDYGDDNWGGEWDGIIPLGLKDFGLPDFNKLRFNPAPNSCPSEYRRDKQVGPFCMLPEQ